jgi:hypothetical protein
MHWKFAVRLISVKCRSLIEVRSGLRLKTYDRKYLNSGWIRFEILATILLPLKGGHLIGGHLNRMPHLANGTQGTQCPNLGIRPIPPMELFSDIPLQTGGTRKYIHTSVDIRKRRKSTKSQVTRTRICEDTRQPYEVNLYRHHPKIILINMIGPTKLCKPRTWYDSTPIGTHMDLSTYILCFSYINKVPILCI